MRIINNLFTKRTRPSNRPEISYLAALATQARNSRAVAPQKNHH